MPLMQWDETMSVGVRELDDQHKTLITLINEAYEAIQRHDENKLASLIEKMHHYSEVHFSVEEWYMKEHGFPDVEKHCETHRQFRNDTNEFRKRLFEKTNLSQVFIYLSRWLTTHIMEDDRKYMPYMPKEKEE